MGSGKRLGAIVITNAKNLTEDSGVIAASLVQQAGDATGTTLLSGAVNTNTGTGVSLTSEAQTVNASITTTGSGTVSFVNAGLLTLNGNIVSDGSVSQSGAGLTTIEWRKAGPRFIASWFVIASAPAVPSSAASPTVARSNS